MLDKDAEFAGYGAGANKRTNLIKSILPYFCLGLAMIGLFVFLILRIEEFAIRQQESSFNDQQLLDTNLSAKGFQESLNTTLLTSEQTLQSAIEPLLTRQIDEAESLRLIKQNLSLNSFVIQNIFLDQNGETIFNVSKEGHDTEEEKKQIQKWVDENWNALQQNSINRIVTPIHATPEEQFFALLFPVRTPKINSFAGAFVALVDVGLLSERFVRDLRSGQYGAGYMLNEDGMVIYDHEMEIIGQNVFGGMHENFPEVLRIDRRLVSEDSGQDEYTFTVDRDTGQQSRKLIAWNSAKLDGRTFVIALSAPDKEISAAFSNLREQIILVVTGLSALLIVVMFYLFRQQKEQFAKTESALHSDLQAKKKSLSEIERSYKDIFNNAAIGIYRANTDGQLLKANPYLCRLLGYENEDQVLANPDATAMSNWYCDSNRLAFIHENLQNSKMVENLVSEVRVRHAEKNIWISENINPVHGDNGELLYYEGTVQNVTSQRSTQEALLKSESHLRAHMRSMPDLEMVISNDGVMIDVYGDEGLLYMNREHVVGKPLTAFASREKTEFWQKVIKDTLEKGETQSFEYNLKLHNTEFWFEGRASLIRAEKTEEQQVIILARDITRRYLDQKALKNALEKADTANENINKTLAKSLPDIEKASKLIQQSGADGSEDTSEALQLINDTVKALRGLKDSSGT